MVIFHRVVEHGTDSNLIRYAHDHHIVLQPFQNCIVQRLLSPWSISRCFIKAFATTSSIRIVRSDYLGDRKLGEELLVGSQFSVCTGVLFFVK